MRDITGVIYAERLSFRARWPSRVEPVNHWSASTRLAQRKGLHMSARRWNKLVSAVTLMFLLVSASVNNRLAPVVTDILRFHPFMLFFYIHFEGKGCSIFSEIRGVFYKMNSTELPNTPDRGRAPTVVSIHTVHLYMHGSPPSAPSLPSDL